MATTSTSPLPAPVTARVHDSPRNSFAADFFGARSASAPRAVDNTVPAPLALDNVEAGVAPPPYEDLPAYGAPCAEPASLAKHLFTFGFLFPLFWLFGAMLLRNTLAEPAEWMDSKSPLERATRMRALRMAERRWARRCLVGWCLLCGAVAVGVVAAVVVVRSM